MKANSGDPDQTPSFAASDLGLHGLPMSHKKDSRRIHVRVNGKISDHPGISVIFVDKTGHNRIL